MLLFNIIRTPAGLRMRSSGVVQAQGTSPVDASLTRKWITECTEAEANKHVLLEERVTINGTGAFSAFECSSLCVCDRLRDAERNESRAEQD
jgi:hypothetical protein